MSIDAHVSKKIRNASCIAAIAVVGIHTAGLRLEQLSVGSSIWCLELLGSYSLFQVAVPFFFLCSGYFLAGHMQEAGWWRRECRKRIHSLLVPYLVWSFVFALIPFVPRFASILLHGHIASLHQVLSWRFWLNALGANPFSWPGLVPLWFVRSLLVFVVISPVLKELFAKIGWGTLLVLYAVSLATGIYGLHSSGKPYLFLTKFVSVSGLFYFGCGMYGRLSGIRLPQKGHAIALFLGLFIMLLKGYCRMMDIKCIAPFGIPFLLFGLWKFVPQWSFPQWLTNATFAIYVLHMVVWRTLSLVCPLPVETVWQWGLKWLSGVGGALMVSMALNRFFPKTAAFLFGGRGR